jgi:NhaP-type Na+/H+ or K+/H+ antiporter
MAEGEAAATATESEGIGLAGEVVLFVFISLLLTIACYEIKKIIKLPPSPLLLVMGILLRDVGQYMGNLGPTVMLLDGIDPHLILLAIMPALIFEAALSTDWYTFKRELGQIIPMATTVVALSSFLTAVTLKYILDYDFSWPEAMLMGVILNATDHVAVVAQLKEISADKRFETLIEGETLLNEATVLVLFYVFNDAIESGSSASSGITLFLRLSVGGFGLGLGFSLCMGYFIERIVNDAMQETNLTLVTAYLIFFVADGTSVHVSGALAVVTYGLYMSAYGKTLISPTVEKGLHGFWNIIATNMESIVFILGGMLLGYIFTNGQNIDSKDISMVFALFVLLHFIRGIAIFVHYPLLKHFGYGITAKEAIVMTIAGLKGVISTALALIAHQDSKISNTKFKELTLFFTLVISAMTIVIDNFIIKFAVKKFGMETLSDVQENMLVGVTTAILQHTQKKIDHLRSDKDFNLVKWDEVLKLAGPKRLLVQIMKNTKVGAKLLKKHPHDEPNDLLKRYSKKFNLTTSVLTVETRRRFYTTLKGIYWHEFESGQCLGYTSLILIDSCNRALDNETQTMGDWDSLEKELFNQREMKIFNKLSKIPLIGHAFKKHLYSKIITTYDAASTFIKAHEETEELMDQMEIDVDEVIFHEVMKEAHLQIEKCKSFVRDHITDSYPEVIAEVQSKMASHTLLIAQRKLINKIYHQGVIKELEYEHLIEAIDKNMRKLALQKAPSVPSIKEILKNRFRTAKEKDIQDLMEMITEKQFDHDEILFKEGEPADGAYLIFNGRVREYSNWIDQELIIGNIVGVQHLLQQYSNNTSTAIASTTVHAAHIPSSILENEVFIEDCYKEASEELILLNIDKFGLDGVKEDHIFRVVKNASIKFFQTYSSVDLKRGCLVLWGKISKQYDTYSFVKPVKKVIECIEKVVVLFFPQHFDELLRTNKTIPEAFASYYVRSMARNVKLDSMPKGENDGKDE